MAESVKDLSPAVSRMREAWELTDPLLSGTRSMREQGERLLPRWPKEEQDAYRTRLAVATLFPAYRRTVGVMAGKPFAKPMTYGDTSEAVLKQWRPWLDDIDRQGVSLHVFAAQMMEETLGHGLAGIYVDFPNAATVERTVSGQVTRAAERRAGLRPYFVRVMHNQLLGWRIDDSGNLAMLRFSEKVDVPTGSYGTKTVERVRVLRPGSWELWEADGKGEFALVDQGTTTLGAIPFVPLYGRRMAFMHGEPPLMDLAHLNVKHWQSQSDQDTILHVARVPILAMIGANDDTELTVGASSAVKLPTGASLEFVEHTGAAIAAGAASLAALEDQMLQTGAELLVKQPGQRTATEAAGDQEANKCELQRITEDFEDALDQALDFAGQYVHMDAPRATLFKDFGAASLDVASGQLIVAMQQGGLITKATAIREQQRRGVLSSDIDPQTELDGVEDEGPALGTLGMNDGNRQ